MLTVPSPHEIRSELAQAMARTTRRWRKLADDRLRAAGLTLSRWQLLQHLAETPNALRQHDLAELLAIDPASLVSQLDGLEALGLVTRSAAPADRRAKLVRLTPAAESLAGQVAAAMEELRVRATAGISNSDLSSAIRALRQIASNLEQEDRN